MLTAILRIKDDKGNWREIPAVKGERGEQGVSIDTIVFKNKVGTVSTYGIQLTDGKEYTFTVTNGNLIKNIALLSTDVLVDTYRISLDDGTHYDFTVTNGRGINGIAKTGTDVLSDTYTISYNDGTTSTYNVTNGRGIVQITKTSTDILTDTYTIYYNDNTTSTYTIKNGRGIDYIEKDEVIGLSDRYTIHYNDGTTSHYHVVNGAAGPAGSIGNRIYLSGLVDKVNDETGYERVKDLYDSSDKVVKLDTIKANNYNVEGTPTITSDGVFTASGNGNKIYKTGFTINVNNEIRTYCRLLYKADSKEIQRMPHINLQIGENIHGCSGYLRKDGSSIYLGIGYDTNNLDHQTLIEIPLNDGDIFDTELIYNATTATLNVTLNESVNYTLSMPSGGLGTFINTGTTGEEAWEGEIDLNTILVYVDGNLVYQPCLKIPYVKSKTDSKIVDAQWIKRVENCYNQYGSGNYYLLDTENEKFSLPMPDIYGLINTLEDKKVNRAGDTMTGTLTINSPDNHQLVVKIPYMDYNVTPTTDQWAGVRLDDKNGQRLGVLEQIIRADGSHSVGINERKINEDGTYSYSKLMVGFDANGNAYTLAPNPTNKLDNSTQIATTHWVREHRCTSAAGTTSTASVDAPCYVVQNYVNGTSWYRIWSDGWIEQGGQVWVVNGHGGTPIALIKNYSDANYCLQVTNVATSITWVQMVDAHIVNKTNSSFQVVANLNNNSANWYTCGY